MMTLMKSRAIAKMTIRTTKMKRKKLPKKQTHQRTQMVMSSMMRLTNQVISERTYCQHKKWKSRCKSHSPRTTSIFRSIAPVMELSRAISMRCNRRCRLNRWTRTRRSWVTDSHMRSFSKRTRREAAATATPWLTTHQESLISNLLMAIRLWPNLWEACSTSQWVFEGSN